MRPNGTNNIVIHGQTYIPERATAERLGLAVMALRRNPVLRTELNMVRLGSHPYYMEIAVENVARELDGYILRAEMKDKPTSVKERALMRETVIYGIRAYPKERYNEES